MLDRRQGGDDDSADQRISDGSQRQHREDDARIGSLDVHGHVGRTHYTHKSVRFVAASAQPPYPRCVPNVDPPMLRKDAERSRAAILAAARELLGTGRDVPMYEIGRHAGVGQATLYRHFPDRSALVAALAREHVGRIEAIAAEHAGDGQALFVVLDAAVEMVVALHDVVGILRQDTALAPVLHELRQRMLAVFEATLQGSPAAPRLRDGVGAPDAQLVLNMVHGALAGIAVPAERCAAARRALDFALNGIIGRDPAAPTVKPGLGAGTGSGRGSPAEPPTLSRARTTSIHQDSHKFHSPASSIRAGTRTLLTISASIRTEPARPTTTAREAPAISTVG